MLLGQRNVQSVVGGRRLQFKIKAHAKALAQRQSPRLIDPSAERRVDHQLHPAAFIKKSFCNHRGLRGHSAQHRASLQNVFDRLLRARIVHSAFFLHPAYRRRHFGLRR
jgi:hypothetical protein